MDALVELGHESEPFASLPTHGRAHRQLEEPLTPLVTEQRCPLRRAGTEGQRLQAVLTLGAHLHQPVTIAQQPQYLPAGKRRPMHLRELLSQQQVEHQLRIATVCLVSAACSTTNLGRVADENFMTETLQQFDEPGALSTGFQADYHVTCELRVEGTNVILIVMQFPALDEAVSRVAVTNSLLTRVEVHATIRRHRHLPRRVSCATGVYRSSSVRWMCLLHNITTLPAPMFSF